MLRKHILHEKIAILLVKRPILHEKRSAYHEKRNILHEKRPFFAYQNIRNLKKSDPKDCSLKYLEQYNYLFFDQKLIMGKVWLCN